MSHARRMYDFYIVSKFYELTKWNKLYRYSSIFYVCKLFITEYIGPRATFFKVKKRQKIVKCVFRIEFQILNFAGTVDYETYSHDVRDSKMYFEKQMWTRTYKENFG